MQPKKTRLAKGLAKASAKALAKGVPKASANTLAKDLAKASAKALAGQGVGQDLGAQSLGQLPKIFFCGLLVARSRLYGHLD